MKHYEIDQFAQKSPFSKFDPRVKLASTIALIVASAFLRDLASLLLVSSFLLVLVLLSGVPPMHFGKNLLLTIPFVGFAALAMLFTSGPMPAFLLLLRVGNSVIALLLLISTTPFFDLLKAMRWFKVPWIITSLILFTYRFIFVFMDELDRMSMARKARGFSGKGSLLSKDVLRTIAFTIGMILVRSNKRAGNIYNALLARGYDGEVRTLNEMKIRPRDAAFASAFGLIAMISLGFQIGVLHWTL